MKRAVPQQRRLIIVFGAVLALVSIAWSVSSRPRTASPVAFVPAPKAQAQVTAPVAVAPTAVKHAAKQVTTATPAPLEGGAAMRIFRDPETGEIGPPTAENLRELQLEQRSQSVRGNTPMRMITLPNGTLELINDGQAEDAMVMQLDAQGHRVMRCVQGDPDKALKHAPVAPATQREDR